MKKATVVLFVFVVCLFNAAAQSSNNELFEKLNAPINDSTELISYLNTAGSFRLMYPDTTIFYFQKAISFCKKNNLLKFLPGIYNDMANIKAEAGNFDSALRFSDSTLKYASLYDKRYLGQVIMHRGNIFNATGKYDEAMNHYVKALTLLNENDSPLDVCQTYNNLIYLLNGAGNAELALEYCNKELQLAEKINNEVEIGWACVNYSQTYVELKQMEKTRKYILRLYEIAKRQNNPDLNACAFNNMGILSMHDSDYVKAAFYYKQAVELEEKLNDSYTLCNSYNNLASAYRKLNQPGEAKKYLEKSVQLSSQIKAKESLKGAYELLADIEADEKNFESAFEYTKALLLLNDTLRNEKSQQQILEMEAKYHRQQIKQENELKEQELVAQKRKQLFLVAGFVIIILISLLLFNRYQLKKKIEQQQSLLAERSRISHDMHDDLGSSLSKIAFMSELAIKYPGKEQIENQLQRISDSAQEAIEKMGEIVWSLNSQNDTVENLVAYLRKYTAEYFEEAAIQIHFNISDSIRETKISGEQRRNIFLSVKEALHNIMKHSDATDINFSVTENDRRLEIIIHDNGKGIDLNKPKLFSNGLRNMKHRSETAGGYFIIENGNGTTVKLGVKIT